MTKQSTLDQAIDSMFNEIESLKQELILAHQKAIETGTDRDLDSALNLKAQIEEKLRLLKAKLWPFKDIERANLSRQYEFQKQTMEKLGLLTRISGGELGIKAINGQEYPFPGLEEIEAMMRASKDILKTKTEQGFNQLVITPFGLSLDQLTKAYGQLIATHYQQKKLLAAKKDPQEPDQLLELDENTPVWVWDGYQNEKLAYYPQEFSRDKHQGQSKDQVLKNQGGFNVLFLEDLPNIPRAGQGKTIGKRPQIDTAGASIKKYLAKDQTIPSPKEYLKALQEEPIYQYETGLTPEDELTYAMLHLEQTNQVIDDWQGNGSINYCLAAYFPSSGNVPIACWNRVNRRAGLGGDGSGDRDGDCGARSGVRVKKP